MPLCPIRLLAAATAFLLAGAVTLTAPATAGPVAEEDRVAIDLRRTTLVVRDMAASLAFYRDALGLVATYDQKIRSPRSAATDAAADSVARLVLLRANDDYIGMIGLLEYQKPPREPRLIGEGAFQPGDVVLLFNTDDLDMRFAAAAASPGVSVLSEPSLTSYPSYDGSSTIDVRVSVLRDPDGHMVELNQLLTPLDN